MIKSISYWWLNGKQTIRSTHENFIATSSYLRKPRKPKRDGKRGRVMTIQEAIERFEYIKANATHQKGAGVSEYWQQEIDATIEAIDMAIEALQKADRKTENSSEKPNNCENCKWGEWYRIGYDITMVDDECGGCCSWNSKWTPKDKPQTDCAWKRGENE